MSWDVSPTAATQLVNITTEQFFSFGGSQKLSLNPGEQMSVQCEANFPASPTDHLILGVYPSIDDGVTYANTPAMEFTISNALDPNRFPITIPGVFPHFRLGVKRSGATDTITSADLKYKKGTP